MRMRSLVIMLVIFFIGFYHTEAECKNKAKKKAPERVLAEEPQEQEDEPLSNYPQFTFDLSLAMGRVQNVDYSEAHLGLNTIFNSWVLWRNAIFGRFMKDTDNLYGLDSTGRLYHFFGGSLLGLGAYAGAGYRFIKDNNAPLTEAGAVFHLMGMINLGLGVKKVHNSAVDPGRGDDTQFSLLLSGGGQL